ncbi:hypothetical protein [Haloferula sp. BvORR071]|uniref:hypothetical protein n=1 Tax=Haloferula sp. BvORR071 TaxID=1396141 RepID=UPI0005504716|nr:hypothetical protein [Haloferula sp. BvORR071]
MTSWLASNWFALIQTAGVVGGLFYSAIALRLDARVRRTEVILALTEAHREIWERLIEQPSLVRVLDPKADLAIAPPTSTEQRFVQLVVLHLDAVRISIKEGAYHASPGMIDDLNEFLALPIPRQVAESLLPYQSHELQEFLRGVMK